MMRKATAEEACDVRMGGQIHNDDGTFVSQPTRTEGHGSLSALTSCSELLC